MKVPRFRSRSKSKVDASARSAAAPLLAIPGGATSGRVPDTTQEVEDKLTEPGAREVRDRLLENGASVDLALAVVREVLREGASGAWAIDAAARYISRAVPILRSPKRKRGSGEPHFFAFVGPTGAGKTSTLAKLGRRFTEAGHRVLYATLDTVGVSELERVGGVDADVDRSELPLVAVRNAADLAKSMRRHPDADIVLLDTPGFSPRDDRRIAGLARELERIGRKGTLDVYLVLPATRSRAAVDLVCSTFARTRPVGCVLTKLDETDEPFEIVEAVGRARLPIAFLCDGMDTRAHLERPTPDRLADLALRGRYS